MFLGSAKLFELLFYQYLQSYEFQGIQTDIFGSGL